LQKSFDRVCIKTIIMENNLSYQNVFQLSEDEIINTEGGSIALAIALCYGLGFATGAAILYFSR
jgi:hypothetical protein